MKVDDSQTIAELNSDRDRDFLGNYSVHDIGQQYCIERINWYGFSVENYGIDERHSDGAVIYDDSPDLLVHRDGTTLGYLEVKCKTSENWMRILNERAFTNYCYGGSEDHDDPFPGAQSIDVSVWLWMALIDDEQQCIVSEGCYPMEGRGQVERSFTAPDNNVVVVLREDEKQSWGDMVRALKKNV